MDNNFQDFILDIEWTKDLGNDLFKKVNKFCKIKSFKLLSTHFLNICGSFSPKTLAA